MADQFGPIKRGERRGRPGGAMGPVRPLPAPEPKPGPAYCPYCEGTGLRSQTIGGRTYTGPCPYCRKRGGR